MLETPLTGGFCVLWQRAYYANLWVHILLWLHCSAYYFWPDRIRQANSQLRFEIYIETVCQCFSKVAALWGETEVNFNGMRSRPDAGRTSPKWVGWPEQETKFVSYILFALFLCLKVVGSQKILPEIWRPRDTFAPGYKKGIIYKDPRSDFSWLICLINYQW